MPTPAERLAAIRTAELNLQTANREFASDMAEGSTRVILSDAGNTSYVRAGGKLRECPVEIWDLRTNPGGPLK